MDMKTFKFLEFAAIFGVLGRYWWSRRQGRPRSETKSDEARPSGHSASDKSTTET